MIKLEDYGEDLGFLPLGKEASTASYASGVIWKSHETSNATRSAKTSALNSCKIALKCRPYARFSTDYEKKNTLKYQIHEWP